MMKRALRQQWVRFALPWVSLVAMACGGDSEPPAKSVTGSGGAAGSDLPASSGGVGGAAASPSGGGHSAVAIKGTGGIGVGGSGTGGAAQRAPVLPQIRVIHASAESRSLDVYLDDAPEPLRGGLVYGRASPFHGVKPGIHRVTLRRHSGNLDTLGSWESAELQPGQRATLIAVGDPNRLATEDGFRILSAVDSAAEAEGAAPGVRLRLAHATRVAPELALRFTGTAAAVGSVSLSPWSVSDPYGDRVAPGAASTLEVSGVGISSIFAVPALSSGDAVLAMVGTEGDEARPLSLLMTDADGNTALIEESAQLNLLQLATLGGRDVFASVGGAAPGTRRTWNELVDNQGFASLRRSTAPAGTYELREYATIAGSKVWPEAAPDGLRRAMGPLSSLAEVELAARSRALVVSGYFPGPRLELFPLGVPVLEQPEQQLGIQTVFAGVGVGAAKLSLSGGEPEQLLWASSQDVAPVLVEVVGPASQRVLLYARADSDELLRSFQFPVVPGRRKVLAIGGRALSRFPTRPQSERPDDADGDTALASEFSQGLPLEPNYLPFDYRLMSGPDGLTATEQDDCPDRPGMDQGCPDPLLTVVLVDVTEPVWTHQVLEPEPCADAARVVASQFSGALEAVRAARVRLAVACSEIVTAVEGEGVIDDEESVTSDAVMRGACSTAASALEDAGASLGWTAEALPGACSYDPGACSGLCAAEGAVDQDCLAYCRLRAALHAECSPTTVRVLASEGGARAERAAVALQSIHEIRNRLALVDGTITADASRLGALAMAPNGCGMVSLLDGSKVLGIGAPPTSYREALNAVAKSVPTTVTVLARSANLLTGG